MFKKSILFMAVLGFLPFFFAAEPVLRVGIISDTHVGKNVDSCKILRGAMELFKQHQVDMIVNCGDIAGKFDIQAYRNYRDTVDGVYAGNKMPAELFAFAWHDRIGRENDPQEQVFEDVKKHLGIRHGLYHRIELRDYCFLVFPQELDYARFEREIAGAVSENPGKPVFIIDHVPPFATFYNSRVWGDEKRRKILEKYPQAVHISGHIHGTLTNELNIWQGKFTAVNAGSVTVWRLPLTGTNPEVLTPDMAMIMEVFPDKLLFRRFFISSGEEYRCDDRWLVPQPFDPAKAVYTENRYADVKAPEFPAGSRVKTVVSEDKVTVTFPAAEHPDSVFTYEISILRKVNDKWLTFARNDVAGNFHLAPFKRKKEHVFSLNAGYFSTPGAYRIKILPKHFSGKTGKIICTEFPVGKVRQYPVVYESSDPMKDLTYVSGSPERKRLIVGSDGFYNNDLPNTRLEFPEHIWKGKEGSLFRFTMDVSMDQSAVRPWNMMFRNDEPSLIVSGRISTPPGMNSMMRYVVELYKFGDFHNYYLLICEGNKGKIRFEYIKVERLN